MNQNEVGVGANGRKRRKQKLKDPNAPKKPLSSYMEFCKSERQTLLESLGPTASITDIGAELGRRWRSLGPEERCVFQNIAVENRQKYEDAMRDYKKNGPTAAPSPPSNECNLDSGSLPSSSGVPEDVQSCTINISDVGFAKQKSHDWHPALKIGVMANGSRIRVQFFGTGQVGTVNDSHWLEYSDAGEARLKTRQRMKIAAFRNGLIEMKNLLSKLQNKESSVASSGISFVPEVETRRLRSLDTDALQKEEEENRRLLEKKMYLDDLSQKWKCRDCNWTDKYKHRAKKHARVCGQRQKIRTRKQHHQKQFECSKMDCNASFKGRNELKHHYR